MDAERDEPEIPEWKRDRNATPLGRGADPGPSVERGPVEAKGIAGLHGGGVEGERGGPAGMIDRENEDARTEARR